MFKYIIKSEHDYSKPTGKIQIIDRRKLKISGLGQEDAGIAKDSSPEYTLSAVKHLSGHLPIGYLYHSAAGTPAKLYYSTNQLDKPELLGSVAFNPNRYQSAIGADGEIIWVNDGNRIVVPKIQMPNTYEGSMDITTPVIPIAWLQNCGIDFAIGADGKEYFIFGEYSLGGLPEGVDMYLWKVTKPYNDPANWRTVLTKKRKTDILHFHTANYDPYTGIWYATSGDADNELYWWYSTDEGETWTELVDGFTWESQVARVLNFVFTEDYIYWANDYGTNHCLNRIKRDSNGVIDVSTREKIAELNKNQSTYATCLLHSPGGILMLDNVDGAFAGGTNKLDVEFWSFADEKLHTLATLERKEGESGHFGFRCKTYTLYQGIYDLRIATGFGYFKNKMAIPHNGAKERTTLLLDVY